MAQLSELPVCVCIYLLLAGLGLWVNSMGQHTAEGQGTCSSVVCRSIAVVLCSGLHYIQLPALLFLIKKKKKVNVANLYILKRLVRSLVKSHPNVCFLLLI